jgi:two-component system NtrC family response regulator
METLCAYHWPGNVRELHHAMERALAAARFEPTLYPKHLPDEIRIHLAQASLSRSASEPVANGNAAPPGLPNLREYREAMDRQYLQDLMAHTAGDIKTACQLSGLSRSRLYELLKHHMIPLPS